MTYWLTLASSPGFRCHRGLYGTWSATSLGAPTRLRHRTLFFAKKVLGVIQASHAHHGRWYNVNDCMIALGTRVQSHRFKSRFSRNPTHSRFDRRCRWGLVSYCSQRTAYKGLGVPTLISRLFGISLRASPVSVARGGWRMGVSPAFLEFRLSSVW